MKSDLLQKLKVPCPGGRRRVAGGTVLCERSALVPGYIRSDRRLAFLLRDITGRGESVFERFTERCHQAVSQARQEAMRLGSDSINTQHLLLGILQTGDGVASHVLRSMKCDLEQLRQRIEELLPPPASPTLTFGQLTLYPQI